MFRIDAAKHMGRIVDVLEICKCPKINERVSSKSLVALCDFDCAQMLRRTHRPFTIAFTAVKGAVSDKEENIADTLGAIVGLERGWAIDAHRHYDIDEEAIPNNAEEW